MFNPFTLKKEAEALVSTNKELTEKLAKLEAQDATKEIEALNGKLKEITEASTVNATKVAELTATNEKLTSEINELKAKLTESEKAMADFNQAKNQAAVDIVAAQGIPVVPVIPEGKTKEEIVAEFNSIKNVALAREFWIKNHAILNGDK